MNLQVENLCFSYTNGKQVLNNLSFSVHTGEFVSVLGPNGVGKSTLFRCLLGNLKDYSGTISLDGTNIENINRRTMAKHIAYIPQTHRPTFGYSVEDTVLMGTTRQLSTFGQPGPKQLKVAHNAMEQVGISHLAMRNFAQLSGGEQQLTLIARAIAQQAEILIMDEPTSALDFGNQVKILQVVKGLTSQGYAVLLSTHNPQHALQFSSRVLCLSNGEIIADGEPSKSLNPSIIEKLYQIKTSFFDMNQQTIILPYIESN